MIIYGCKKIFICKMHADANYRTNEALQNTFEILERWARTNKISTHTFSSIIQKKCHLILVLGIALSSISPLRLIVRNASLICVALRSLKIIA